MNYKAVPDMILFYGVAGARKRMKATDKALKSNYLRATGRCGKKMYYRMGKARREQIEQMIEDCIQAEEYTIAHIADLVGIHPEVVVNVITDSRPNFDRKLWDEMVILGNYRQTHSPVSVLSRRHRVPSNVTKDIIERYHDRQRGLVKYSQGILRIAQTHA